MLQTQRVEVHREVNGVCVCPLCKGRGLIEDFWSKVLNNDSPVLAACERCGGTTGLVLSIKIIAI